MFVLKGFVTHSLLANNSIGVVAPFGEISTQSLTYAREKGLHRSDAAPNLTLISFLVSRDQTMEVASADLTNHVLDIAHFVYNKVLNSATDLFSDQLAEDLLEAFDAVAADFECGDIIHNGSDTAPEWVSWRNTSIPELGENVLKIWLADGSFRDQYDEFEIVVVPPVDQLDDFFKSAKNVADMVKAITPADTMLRIQQAKNNNPETVIRAPTFNYIDPFNSSNKIAVTWPVLIYGIAGDNTDAINDAIASYILAHSTHLRPDWLKTFPDIFRRTEFILVPLTDQYAIPNRLVETGIYSPIVNLKRAAALIKQVGVSYPESHINEHVSVFSHVYKSLQILIVGGPENRNDWFDITDVYPDYIAVSTASIDYNRMSQPTKDWSYMLSEMLLVAEKMTPFSSVPLGMSRVHRDGKIYLAKSIGNINYLMLIKSNLPTVITGE